MSSRAEIDRAYKLIFAKTGRPKELRSYAKNTFRKRAASGRLPIPEVMVKITSFGKTGKSLSAHYSYISRNNELDVYDSMDDKLGAAGESQRDALKRFARDVAFADKGTNKNKRLTCNLILSMPPNTPSEPFRASVRDMLSETFGNHDYIYTFHTDTDNEHAHVSVPMLGHDGTRLNPRKQDIADWRQSFAASLERNGILANAMPAPANNLKTLRRDSMKYRDTVLADHGHAPYAFDDSNALSYFASVIDSKTDEKKTYWGQDLKNVIDHHGFTIGERVSFNPIIEEGMVRDDDDPYRVIPWEGRRLDAQPGSSNGRALSDASKNKVVQAWHIIKEDLEAGKDYDTAEAIRRFCLARFVKYFESSKKTLPIDEKVR